MTVKTYPRCPRCNRMLQPGTHWFTINLCRLLILLEAVESEPDLSTAELAMRTGMSYADASKAMTFARSHDLVTLEPEDREQGGVRYRYRALPSWREHHMVSAWEQ